MTPTRIQRRRTAGWRTPKGAVYVGRGSRWGNPFVIKKVGDHWTVTDSGDRSRGLREDPPVMTCWADAAAFATEFFALQTGPMGLYEYDPDTLALLRERLAGRDLLCWCPLPAAGETDHCHAVVLMEIARELA